MVEQPKFFSRRRLVRLGGLWSLGLLAACGPAAQPSPAVAPKPTAAPQPTAPAAKPTAAPTATVAAKPEASPTARSYAPASVTVLSTATNKAKALSEVIEGQGYYKQFGLTATTSAVPDGARVLASVVAGTGDIGVNTGPGPVFVAVGQGAGLKIISGGTNKLDYLVCTGNSAVKTLRDLEGKSVGAGSPGTLTHMLMLAVFKKNGVDPNKVTFVNIGSSTDVYRAIVAKKIDGGPAQVEFLPSMAQDGVTAIAEVWKELPDYLSTTIFTSDQAIAAKRDLLVRTLAAWGQAFRFLRKPESEAVYVAAMKNQGAPEAQARVSWQWSRENRSLAYDLTLTDQQLTYMQQVNVDAELQEAVLPFEKIADMSLARDALKIMTIS